MFKRMLMLLALMLPASQLYAQTYQVQQLTVANPWSMELPPNAPTVAAYFVIHNHGQTADRLISVESPVAGLAQLHEHVSSNGLMKMQHVPSVEIAPGGDARFAPMGYHVMLLELRDKSKLIAGHEFPLTLHFEHSGAVTVQIPVLKQAPDNTEHTVHSH